MRKKVYAFILFLLVVTYEIVLGKETTKTKHHKTNKKLNSDKEKSYIERLKRSLDNEEDKPFWANRGKKKLGSSNHYKSDNDIDKATKFQKRSDYFEKEPFWGARGRRQSASTENYEYDEYTEYPVDRSNCKDCFGKIHFDTNDRHFKDRRDDSVAPFWGNRGRRNSDEVGEHDPFWGNRGRRQENDPFWGARGRRRDLPFWGARERREYEPFWGSRGRRNDEPFWGSRGRRDDPDPFWGSRGRRQDSLPFWGNRGRRDEEPFWGNRGRRRETEPFWSNQGRKKEDLKESIKTAINLVEDDIEHLSRLRRSEPPSSFWSNRGRDSQLKNMFNTPSKNRFGPQKNGREFFMHLKTDPGTVHDSRIFAEEPHYIVVERSSRSSAESEDPFFISRGKKYYLNYDLIKAARDRRGAIEEIVKTVRNDPYYIARGKKNIDLSTGTKINSTSEEEFLRVKELICAAVDMVNSQQHGKVKREIDSDRNRRSMLQKLAAQLQIDPYYVSRGKKSENAFNKNNIIEFITEVADKCD